ncbi:hypothetical protein [Sphingomonas jaspsi]|uniref:hypothetical protein n=1 Tax=Sphingomonas jaspsi TaxID=392409 RepID=UPI0004B0D3CE|nr:hypothetical protein [Sphingomonas jaspsi]
MTSTPIEHIQDAHKLVADAEIDLFELTPIGGGTVYFKNENEVTWQGNLYEGLPVSFDGIKRSSQGTALAPKMNIGDGTVDLSPFKPLVFDGWLDDATVRHIMVLREHVEADVPIFQERFYRVKRLEEYHRMWIAMQLATASDALGFTLPHRQYHPPAFPAVAPQ